MTTLNEFRAFTEAYFEKLEVNLENADYIFYVPRENNDLYDLTGDEIATFTLLNYVDHCGSYGFGDKAQLEIDVTVTNVAGKIVNVLNVWGKYSVAYLQAWASR